MWIPKYRHKVFVEPYRSTMKAIIQKIGYDAWLCLCPHQLPLRLKRPEIILTNF